MRCRILYVIVWYLLITGFKLSSQNLIGNPSFSEILDSSVTSIPYKINYHGKSNVKDWYILNTKNKMSIPFYYTVRDINHYTSKRIYTYSEHMLYTNYGFVKLDVNWHRKSCILQQKFSKAFEPGEYCFTFKYKKIRDEGQHISFSFSKTDLTEYINKGKNVPNDNINFHFIDSTTIPDENVEWQTYCTKINLKGNEQYPLSRTCSP